ncbi:MAG: multiheme c-type cytochrome, partial [Gammaproteobacteria bacterium]
MKKKTVILGIVLLSVAAFLLWRFIRPMNIFVISEAFERPIDTSSMPALLKTLRADECGACHQDYYKEWQTTVHSQAWTDPYFQVDWTFEDKEQICRNCHTPLDRQQEHTVLGFRDREKWDPILAPNPAFDSVLQHEGVTCAGCHLREGQILGPYGLATEAHPVTKIDDPNQVCVRCHVVGGGRWDTFYRFPPCGTVAEIEAGRGARRTSSGETQVTDVGSLQCVECHMPRVERPLVPGGQPRPARQHFWRGGHDPATVKRALTAALQADPSAPEDVFRYRLALTNTGTA